jgi:hypothetical protein
MLAVASIWAFSSVLTVVGIGYLILLFVFLLRRGLIACGIMFWLWIGGALLVGLASPDGIKVDNPYSMVQPKKASTYDLMYKVDGKWVSQRNLLGDDKALPEDQEPVYRGSLGVGRYIFHPAALVWCPFFVMLAAIPMWLLGMVPLFGYKGLLGD